MRCFGFHMKYIIGNIMGEHQSVTKAQIYALYVLNQQFLEPPAKFKATYH